MGARPFRKGPYDVARREPTSEVNPLVPRADVAKECDEGALTACRRDLVVVSVVPLAFMGASQGKDGDLIRIQR
jgi:hypothetical protein